MKTQINLSELFAGIISLLFIGLISISSQYEEMESAESYHRENSVEYLTWELKEILDLSERQELKLRKINYDFYDHASTIRLKYNTDREKMNREIDQLISKRNIHVLEVLDRSQKEILTNNEFFLLAKRDVNR